jgi:hypothetical protein
VLLLLTCCTTAEAAGLLPAAAAAVMASLLPLLLASSSEELASVPLLEPTDVLDMNTLGPPCVLLLAASWSSLSICCFTRSCQDLQT